MVGLVWPLTTGGTVVLPDDDEVHDVDRLGDLVERAGVTHVLMVPSLYRAVLDRAADRLSALAVSIVAGEACPMSLVQRHHELLADVELVNEYGPTEATVWATAHRLSADRRPRQDRSPDSRHHAADRRRPPGAEPGRCRRGAAHLVAGRGRGLPRRVAVGTVRRARRSALVPHGRSSADRRRRRRVRRAHRRPAQCGRRAAGAGRGRGRARAARWDPQCRRGRCRRTADARRTRRSRHARRGRRPLGAQGAPLRARRSRAGSGCTPTCHGLRTARSTEFAAALLPFASTRPSAIRPAGRSAVDTVAVDTVAVDTVVEVWRDVLDRDDVTAGTDFFSIGGDSLAAVSIVVAVGDALGRTIPIAALLTGRTPAGMAATVRGSNCRGPQWSALTSSRS